MKELNRRDIISFLEEAEKALPINQWKYGDIDIWPIVKKEIFFRWHNRDISNHKKSKSLFLKTFQLFLSMCFWLSLKLKRKTETKVFLAGAASHRVEYQGYFINRYYYPKTQEHRCKSFKIVEYGQRDKSKSYDNPSEVIFLQHYNYFALLLVKLRKKEKLNLPKWEIFEERVEKQLEMDIKGYFPKLSKELNAIRAYAFIFKALFNKYKPEKSLGLCYYNTPMLGMHYMANKKGIINWDVQHGGQGRLHPMYYYSNPPKNGYNVAPQKFWCWDRASALNISRWLKKQNYHQVEVRGNPWIEYQLKEGAEWQSSNKKIILYTIQEIELDEFIIKAIQQTNESFEWWLRLHPRKKFAKVKILKQLRSVGMENSVIVDKATELPLPLILKHAMVHISKYSGSIIEAAQIGTPTIIIDKIGIETYREYIESGMATCLPEQNENELLKEIYRTYKI